MPSQVVKEKVKEAIENLRAYLGEYRALPEGEAEARRAAQSLKKQAELAKWNSKHNIHKDKEGVEVETDEEEVELEVEAVEDKKASKSAPRVMELDERGLIKPEDMYKMK